MMIKDDECKPFILRTILLIFEGEPIHCTMMNELPDVLNHFLMEGVPVSISPTGSGHINDSYFVKTASPDTPDYILQRINHVIFKDIPKLMENIARVTHHLRGRLDRVEERPDYKGSRRPSRSRIEVLRLVETRKRTLYHQDPGGNFWRMYHYVPGTHSFDRVPGPTHAYEGGRAFGLFQNLTSDLDPSTLVITIPRFHDITWRMEQFEDALRCDISNRASRIPDLIRFVRQRADEMHTIHRLIEAGKLPVRVTHNDTKFNNILFDEEEKAVCIVDLDTVMPGTVLYDFGDAIRTGANTADEDEPDLEKVDVDLDLFKAYTRGFLETAGTSLTPVEIGHLVHSAAFMTYLIGLRFLTDYLSGDIYYKIRHPEHNLQRARVQFRLMERMAANFKRMQEFIRK